MMNDETMRKLRELNLSEIITALEIQNQDISYTSLTFDDRIKRMVDYLYQEKYNGKVQRLIKLSKFRISKAEINDIYFLDRGIDRQTILELSTCQFLEIHSDIIFQGFTGSGKTFLACAIGRQSCKQGIRTRYIRIPDLLLERDEATFCLNLWNVGMMAPRLFSAPSIEGKIGTHVLVAGFMLMLSWIA